MDPLSLVVDEVSLEGLDGITIPSLWIRLQNRQPKFPLMLDDCTKEYIWRSLVSNTELTFYELPQNRDDVELWDRYKDIDPETGIETKDNIETVKDVYPVNIIFENKDGIQGSCIYFNQRKDITKHVRSQSNTPLITLDNAWKRYNRKLVVVASQVLRFRTLIGRESDPELKLSDDSYCVLERVGRARWQGELQRDLHVCSFKIDARKLHYMRKSLVRYGLVTLQSHVTRMKQTCQQQHSILLLLKRFHVNRRTKYDILMEQVSNFLEKTPGHLTSLVALREHLNVDEGSFKRAFHYMRAAKFVAFCLIPMEEFDPSSGPCKNKRGDKLLVRCLKMLKPYSKKGVADDDDDDDDDDEDDNGARRGQFAPVPRIMERDVLSQAYDFVLASGTKGIPQRPLSLKMNIGKLEVRMICRKLERDGIIKGFMEDVGRQRITRFISHKCVDVSDKLQLIAKEQERNTLLCSSAPIPANGEPTSPEAPSTSNSSTKAKGKAPAVKKKQNEAGGDVGKEVEEDVNVMACAGKEEKMANGGSNDDGPRGGETADKKSDMIVYQTQRESAVVDAAAAECESSALNESRIGTNSVPAPETGPTEEDNFCSSTVIPVDQSEAGSVKEDTPIVVVEDIPALQLVSHSDKSKKVSERSHETYRVLKRKNLIVETVRHAQVVDGLFPLQKMIIDAEKQDGVSSKCCKKTILRLLHILSKEGLLKLYTTTVIQDGVTKKIDMIAHPSVQPTDEIVQRVIEQVRFKISSSSSAGRLQQSDDKGSAPTKASDGTGPKSHKKNANKKKTNEDKNFSPTPVRGLGKSFGFQPKMHRLHVVHNFLWYVIYGHPLQSSSESRSHTPILPNGSESNATTESSGAPPSVTQATEAAGISSAKPEAKDSVMSSLDPTSSADEDDDHSQSEKTVYSDEDSWKKYVPPVHVNKDLGSGWAMVGDLLLCLPLSLFIQVVQINYQVDGLEEYLNNTEKQHYLVRALPPKMRRQLLYRRKYIFHFHENLQKLAYMGLIQFGPMEKFKDKDQAYVYLKRNATIVDTTNAEPHYWLVAESPDKPFERRQYTFNTSEDTENYWFDLMCVCLNTPLGVIRSKKIITEDEAVPPFVRERSVFAGMAHLLKGSREVIDNGSIPGDGKGAGGLDSEFFGHLKRNWLWTNHLLSVKKRTSGLDPNEAKMRLKSLSKTILRTALKSGQSTTLRYATGKKVLITEENVEVAVEPASRNQRVVGGKRQKRKRMRKEAIKPRSKKKEPKKRLVAHDEADHKALKLMTGQRVYWSVQEDSLMMLCSVASHLLNSKLKKPFIPYLVVRDLLHTEFEKSRDKTSLAVGRRTRYILKNPQTLLNYRICLAEVHLDKPLMRLLDKKKPSDPTKLEECNESFLEYAKLLRQKFSSAMNPSESVLPDTKQQLCSRFKICAIDTGRQISCKDVLNCTDDIHAIVLDNLIQSTLAMTNSQMKNSRSFQTFHMYSKYTQEMLCQVFIQCRKRGLVNRRRVSKSFGPKMNRSLPILPMSYQLSQSFFRSFSFRYPHSLCTDAFRFLRNLLNCGAEDERPFISFYHETEHRSMGGDVLESRKTPQKKERGATTVPDGTKEDSSNQSQTEGDQKTMEVDVANERTEAEMVPDEPKNPDDHLTSGSTTDKADTPQTERPGGSLNAASPGPDESLDVSNMMLFSLDNPGGACAAALSLMTLGLLSVHMSIPKQMVVVDSTLVDNDVVKNMAALEEEDDEDYDGEECEGRRKLEVKAHQASHTNYLMMRGYCFPGIAKLRNLNSTDNIVVESCIMRLQLRNLPAHHIFTMESSYPLDLSKCGPSLLPPALTSTIRTSTLSHTVEEREGRLMEQRGYSSQDVEVCARIRRSLDEAGDKGVDVQDFVEAHKDLEEPHSGCTRSLQQYMQDLAEEGEVLQVGAVRARWVLMQHAEPWLLTIQSKQWSQSRLTSDGMPFLENRHDIPFMRKRNRIKVQEDTEETPAKKAALDENQDENTSEKLNEGEEQKEGADGERGEQVEEEGSKMHMEKEEDNKMQTETRPRRGSVSEKSRSPMEQTDPTDDENESFISRPWRMVDGKLNRQVCKGMMEGVLYHIMSHPGVTQETLLQHYRNVLQPVAVLDLVEALVDMGCVEKKTLLKPPKPSLFSRFTHPTKSDGKVNTEEPDAVFYEPTICCSLRLSRVLPNERHWNSELP